MSDHHEPPYQIRLAVPVELHDQDGRPQAPQNYSKTVPQENSSLWYVSIRRDKQNSQFIVTKFSILHAGGRSLLRFQTSRETRMAYYCCVGKTSEF